MNVKQLFYILSGWQVPYYRLDYAQWFALEPEPSMTSALYEKTINIEGRDVERMTSLWGKKVEISGMVLVSPVDMKEGKDGKYVTYRNGVFGFWSRPDWSDDPEA